MWSIIAIVLVSMTFGLQAQLTFEKVKYSNATLSQIDSIRGVKTPYLIFFCPHNNKKNYAIDDTLYDLKFSMLRRKLEYEKIDTLNVLAVHTDYSLSKGIFLRSKDRKDSIFVDYSKLECFVLNFDTNYLDRAINKFRSNFTLLKPYKEDKSLIRLDIIDSAQCFKDLPSRIPGYAEFIGDAIKPKYDTNELLSVILEKLGRAEKKLNELEKIINKLDSVIQKEKDVER